MLLFLWLLLFSFAFSVVTNVSLSHGDGVGYFPVFHAHLADEMFSNEDSVEIYNTYTNSIEFNGFFQDYDKIYDLGAFSVHTDINYDSTVNNYAISARYLDTSSSPVIRVHMLVLCEGTYTTTYTDIYAASQPQTLSMNTVYYNSSIRIKIRADYGYEVKYWFVEYFIGNESFPDFTPEYGSNYKDLSMVATGQFVVSAETTDTKTKFLVDRWGYVQDVDFTDFLCDKILLFSPYSSNDDGEAFFACSVLETSEIRLGVIRYDFINNFVEISPINYTISVSTEVLDLSFHDGYLSTVTTDHIYAHRVKTSGGELNIEEMLSFQNSVNATKATVRGNLLIMTTSSYRQSTDMFSVSTLTGQQYHSPSYTNNFTLKRSQGPYECAFGLFATDQGFWTFGADGGVTFWRTCSDQATYETGLHVITDGDYNVIYSCSACKAADGEYCTGGRLLLTHCPRYTNPKDVNGSNFCYTEPSWYEHSIDHLNYVCPGGCRCLGGQEQAEPCRYVDWQTVSYAADSTGKRVTSAGTQCIPCHLGHYCDYDSVNVYEATMTPCPAGTHQPDTGRKTCLLCPDHTYNDDLTIRSYCKVAQGYYYNTEADLVETCPAGHWCSGECIPNTHCDGEHANKHACSLIDGELNAKFYQDETGSYNSDQCKTADKGYYTTYINDKNVRTGQEACPAGHKCLEGLMIPCEANTYQPSTQQTSCLTCPDGTHTNGETGQTTCKHVSAGWFADNEIVKPCKAGHSCEGGCISSTLCTEPLAVQTPCTGAEYQPAEGASTCEPVTKGYYTTPEGAPARTGQTECPAGYKCVAGVKTACEVDTYQPSTGQSTCLSCDTSLTTNNKVGQTSCNYAAPGYFVSEAGVKPCEAGHSCEGGCISSTLCTEPLAVQTPCTGAEYQPAEGASTCEPVTKGYYTTPEGAPARTGQTECKAGYKCVGGVKTACEVNTYQPATTQTSCQSCPANTTTNDLTAQTHCVVPRGYYAEGGEGVICPAGHYCLGGCLPDTTCTGDEAVKTVCSLTNGELDASKYQDEEGQPDCKTVTEGYYTTYTTDASSRDGQTICPAGYKCEDGTKTECVNDSTTREYQPEPGQSECKSCSDKDNYKYLISATSTTCDYCSTTEYHANNACQPCGALSQPSVCTKQADVHGKNFMLKDACIIYSQWWVNPYQCRYCQSDEICNDDYTYTWKFKATMDPETVSGKMLIAIVVVALIVLSVLTFWLAYYLRHKGLSRRSAGAKTKVEAQFVDEIQL